MIALEIIYLPVRRSQSRGGAHVMLDRETHDTAAIIQYVLGYPTYSYLHGTTLETIVHTESAWRALGGGGGGWGTVSLASSAPRLRFCACVSDEVPAWPVPSMDDGLSVAPASI